MKKCQLSFVGAGKMAGAIIGGVLNKKLYAPSQVGVYDHTSVQMDPFRQKGCVCFDSIPELTQSSEIVVLSVKPQNFPDILPLVKQGIEADTIIVSIAAGISAQTLHDALGQDCKVVLAGPNTPFLVGEGATVLSYQPPITQEDFARVSEIFGAEGMVREISPSKMKEAIPVNGSSPAFVYLFADVLAQSAASVGLNYQDSLELVAQTLIGSARMILESGKTPQQLIEMVCSPGGTTIAGMEALEQFGFSQALENAFSACIYRAKELSGETVDTEEPNITLSHVIVGTPEYEQVNALRYNILRKPYGLELTEEDIALDEDSIIVAAVNENAQLVGTAQAVIQDVFSARIRFVAIPTSLRHTGIASMLMADLEDALKEKNLMQIILNAPISEEEFYIRQGFQPRGETFLESGVLNVAMVKDLTQ